MINYSFTNLYPLNHFSPYYISITLLISSELFKFKDLIISVCFISYPRPTQPQYNHILITYYKFYHLLDITQQISKFPQPIMQRSSNPSSIKIQMNNFTLNLQTLLSKDNQQLPTTQRKVNKTERRTKSNFEDISPLKVKKKTKEKDYATTKNKTKKQDLFEISKPASKPSKVMKEKKQSQTSKKPKKTQPKNTQSNTKSRKDKSTRLQRHFTDYDHVIESARLRTSPSQNYHHQNFNSESISKSASRSRSKSYKKIKNEKESSNRNNNKSRSKSIFETSHNERLNTQRSTSKIKSKQVQRKQKNQQQMEQKSTQKIIKKRRSSKSRQRKSIDNYAKKSKSRQRIYTQVNQRHPLDDKHFNSDYIKNDNEKVFMSHKKSKSKFERLSDNLMSNSSELGTMGPKFTSNKGSSKDKLGEKSQKKKKSKKVSATASTTNIQKQPQSDKQKQKKLNASKKLSTKPSRKQTIKQKQTLESQFNFYQSTNVQKKKSTQEDTSEFMERTTAKKSKKMKTQAGQIWDNSKFEVCELSGWKKGRKDEEEGWAVEKAFKKKKKAVDIVDKLFSNQNNESGNHQNQRLSTNNQYQGYDQENSGSLTQRITSSKPSQPLPSSLKPRPQSKKLTIMTDFNPLQNKQIYFDDISKILLKKKKSQQEERESMSRSQKSIRDEVMESRNESISQEWIGERGERADEGFNDKEERFDYVLNNDHHHNSNKLSSRSSHIHSRHSPQRESQIRRIRQQDLKQSSSDQQQQQQNSASYPQSNEVHPPASLQVRSQSSHELDQLQQLNNHLEKLINDDHQSQQLSSERQSERRQNQQDSKLLDSKEVSIKDEPSFGRASPVNNYNRQKKPHPKSYTFIQTTVKKTKNQDNTDMMTSNNESDTVLQNVPKTSHKRGTKDLFKQSSDKKSISSTFIRERHSPLQGRTPLCSPSSYAMQNKQKVISSLLHKPRKSVQEQFMIAKTLSNKRLLEELELLETLEKIQKSVENSLIHEGSTTRNYYGVGSRGDDIVQEKKVSTMNYQSNRGQRKQELSVIDKLVVFDNSEEEEIDRLQEQLLLRESSHVTRFKNEQKKNKDIVQLEEEQQIFIKSPQTLLLNTQDRVKQQQQKQDSPLLSNNSSEFKKPLPNIKEFKPTQQHIINNKYSPKNQKQFKRSSPIVPTLNTNQLKVNPFQHTYEEIQNFFSNNSCISSHNRDNDQCEIKLFLGSGSGGSRGGRPQSSHNQRINTRRSTEEILVEDEEFQLEGNNHNNSKKKVEYSELTLEFEREMDDYLKDHKQAEVKSKIQQIKANAFKSINNNNNISNSDKTSNNGDGSDNSKCNNNKKPLDKSKHQQQQSYEHSDEFFYHPTKPSTTTKPHLLSQQPSNNQLLTNQMTELVLNKLLQQFCQFLTNNKQLLHAFLFFISKCNLVVIDSQESQKQQRQLRQINQEKFMEYLQAQIYSNNQYIMSLATDILGFVKKSEDNQALFVKNINRPFGILPLKTLRWMRKVYAEEEETKKEQQEEKDEQEDQENNDEQDKQNSNNNNQQQKQQQSSSMSGLSDCSQVQAIFPPTLLADFDAYQSQNIIQQMNQQQFYLNHAVYASLNQICDRFRPYGQNGYPVIPKHKPKLVSSIQQVESKIMARLKYVLGQRWGRIQFAADEQPEKVINETYKRMDDDLRRDDDERWSERNMDDTVFENVYYLSKHIVEMVINQEIMEIFRMINN